MDCNSYICDKKIEKYKNNVKIRNEGLENKADEKDATEIVGTNYIKNRGIHVL